MPSTRIKIFLLALLMASSAVADVAAEQAKTLFRTLTGTPLRSDDPRLAYMAQMISAGNIVGAADVATTDDNFYDVTLVHWASHLSNRDEFQRTPMNDFIATVVGTAADGRDARELLYADALYVGNNVPGIPADISSNNAHYAFLEASRLPLRTHLRRQSPQRAGVAGAGLLTTWTYMKNHAFAGTNRRLAEYAVREFMCKSISDIADLNAPRDRIRRDVDRSPGGNTAVFNNKCAGCHSILDGFAGAFAFSSFAFTDAMTKESGVIETLTAVAPKMNQNNTNYPAGYVTTDDSFVNNAIYGANQALGFRGATSGRGVAEFGRMLANSQQFSRCMAQRTYSQLCINVDYAVDRLTQVQRDQLDAASAQIEGLAQDFEDNGYNLRRLFGQAAALPKCLAR